MSYKVFIVIRTTETPMIVGYARTSSTEQRACLEAQGRDLKGAGAEKVYA